ncbi:MAG: hypothetical protein P8M80_05945 [Pirellulaceae bacterium]|nr:hypothetical protein [Pirellulaceae bacterium]
MNPRILVYRGGIHEQRKTQIKQRFRLDHKLAEDSNVFMVATDSLSVQSPGVDNLSRHPGPHRFSTLTRRDVYYLFLLFSLYYVTTISIVLIGAVPVRYLTKLSVTVLITSGLIGCGGSDKTKIAELEKKLELLADQTSEPDKKV